MTQNSHPTTEITIPVAPEIKDSGQRRPTDSETQTLPPLPARTMTGKHTEFNTKSSISHPSSPRALNFVPAVEPVVANETGSGIPCYASVFLIRLSEAALPLILEIEVRPSVAPVHTQRGHTAERIGATTVPCVDIGDGRERAVPCAATEAIAGSANAGDFESVCEDSGCLKSSYNGCDGQAQGVRLSELLLPFVRWLSHNSTGLDEHRYFARVSSCAMR